MAINYLQDWHRGMDKILVDAMVGLSLLGNFTSISEIDILFITIGFFVFISFFLFGRVVVTVHIFSQGRAEANNQHWIKLLIYVFHLVFVSG